VTQLDVARSGQVVVWGTLWGLAVSAAEGIAFQARWSDLSPAEFIRFWLGLWVLPGWCVVGGLYLVAVRLAERRGRPALLAGWLLISVGWAITEPMIGATRLDLLLHQVPFGRDLLFYILWLCLFYGGLLMAAYRLALQADRTSALLQDAAIARGRTTVLRDQVELGLLRRRVDPTLLVDVLHDIEQLYRRASRHADVLLDRLVEFLRCATQGVNGQLSTLEGELQLLAAYQRLQAARGGPGDDAAHAPVAAPDGVPLMPFPGQLLLPLLALGGPAARLCLSVRRAPEEVVIELHGLGQAVPESLEQRMRVELQSLFGGRFRLQTGGTSGLALSIGLRPPFGDDDGTP